MRSRESRTQHAQALFLALKVLGSSSPPSSQGLGLKVDPDERERQLEGAPGRPSRSPSRQIDREALPLRHRCAVTLGMVVLG